MRRAEAVTLLDRLDRHLADGRQWIVAPVYSAADVVWTVFLARMQFTGLLQEVLRRPALSRYWSAMQERPSFVEADVWTKLHLGRLLRAILLAG